MEAGPPVGATFRWPSRGPAEAGLQERCMSGVRRSCVAVALAAVVWTVAGSAQQHTPLFVDVTDESGLVFTHTNGATGELLLPEVIGSGGALFDYDNDGDLDVFLVQGIGGRGIEGRGIEG